ncbi:MAG: hypothetical protein LBC73_01645 [Oscillospiraceae bacterium]|jgi:hypothetical protein|nr:hypothetical protein [Oscillospiraceae bacterium]
MNIKNNNLLIRNTTADDATQLEIWWRDGKRHIDSKNASDGFRTHFIANSESYRS